MKQPIPEGLICLTFDDGVKSQYSFVAPLLETLGFGATFFISEGLRFLEDKTRYMTWEEIAELNDRDFEIGNHTRAHKNVNEQSTEELLADIEHIDRRCRTNGIRHPDTFCYPGYNNGPAAVAALRARGFNFARRGTDPEYARNRTGGRGPAYNPTQHDPLLIPTTGAAGPEYSLDDFKWSVSQATAGNICVLTYHGVPDLDHAWVHVDPDVFTAHMRYLHDTGCTVIALRDLKRYVMPSTARDPC